MKFTDLIKYSFSNVFRGRLRSVLTILSVAIGVASVILVLTIGDGGREAVAAQLDKIGVNGTLVFPKQTAIAAGVVLTDSDAYELENIRGIDRSMPLMVRYGSYKIKNWQGNIIIYGIDSSMKEILNVDLLYGRYPNKSDIRASKQVAIISEGFAKMVYNRSNIVGKQVSLYVGSRSLDFEIIGVISTQNDIFSQILGDTLPEFVYVPYSATMKLTGEVGIDEIVVQTESEPQMEKVISHLNNKHGRNSFKSENIGGIRSKFDSIVGLVAMLVGAIASISVLVAGIGIMNTMISAAIERKYEIGIYLTLGATSKDIFLSFLVESAAISAIGGVVGIVVVLILLIPVSSITGNLFSLNMWYVLIAEISCIVCGIIFGVIPAIKAAALNPIDAIRSE